MTSIGELHQTADWKSEKHVPVIDCPDSATRNEPFMATVSVGKEIAHPNKTEHHIRWIELYFLPNGGKFAYQVGRYEFTAHGESTEGPDTGPVHAAPAVTARLTLATGGTLIATSYCNIHGLWESAKAISVG